jgi:hypothetical protein
MSRKNLLNQAEVCRHKRLKLILNYKNKSNIKTIKKNKGYKT